MAIEENVLEFHSINWTDPGGIALCEKEIQLSFIPYECFRRWRRLIANETIDWEKPAPGGMCVKTSVWLKSDESRLIIRTKKKKSYIGLFCSCPVAVRSVLSHLSAAKKSFKLFVDPSMCRSIEWRDKVWNSPDRKKKKNILPRLKLTSPLNRVPGPTKKKMISQVRSTAPYNPASQLYQKLVRVALKH